MNSVNSANKSKLKNPASIIFSCYDEKELIEISKRKNEVVEEKLNVKNMQMSFPIYPTYIFKPDILIKQTCNIGLLSYMAKHADEMAYQWLNGAAGTSGDGGADSGDGGDHSHYSRYAFTHIPRPIKTIKDFNFEYGLPFELVDVGKKLDIKEFPLSGKRIELREFEFKRNPILQQNGGGVSSSGCNPPCSRKDLKESESDNENKSVIVCRAAGAGDDGAVGAISYKKIFSLISLPIVTDHYWRSLCILLSQKHAAMKDKILNHLWMPIDEFDIVVLNLLQNPKNQDVLSLFNSIREELNNISNSAYMQAFIYSIMSFFSLHNWIPLFPYLLDTGRGQDVACILDPHVCAAWKQYIIIEQTENYYNDALVMHSEIDLEMFLANLFQIVFGLDYAQQVTGLVVNDLDIRKIGYVKTNPTSYLNYLWGDKYYRLPTNGKLMKIPDLSKASMVIEGVRHSAAPLAPAPTPTLSAAVAGGGVGGHNVPTHSFNTDLIRLGATIKQTLYEKQMKTVVKDESISTAFNTMMDQWINCSPSLTKAKCLVEEDINNSCSWQKFGEIPNHHICNKAVPHEQRKFFEIFQVDKCMIPPDEHLYILP